MALNFYLDGNLVQDPIGWDNLEIVKERDDVIRGLITTYTTKLTFIGDGYSYLKKEFDINGWCAQISVKIDIDNYDTGIFEELFVGKIILSDAVWDLTKKEVECQVVDNTWGAQLFARKEQKIQLNIGLTLNQSTFTPTTTTTNLFDTAGVYTAMNRDCVYLFDAFTTIVTFITNGEVGFISDCFSNSGGVFGQKFVLMNGAEIRNGAGRFPEVSLLDLFQCCNKIFNLTFAIEYVGSNPYLRIDRNHVDEAAGQTNFIYTDSIALTLANARNISMKINQKGLYNAVEVGDENAIIDDTAGMMFPYIAGINHEVQNFQVDNRCGLGSILDLRNTIIWYNSNAIMDCLNGNNAYDNEVFLIEENAIYDAAKYYPYGTLNSPVYNGAFFNSELLNRWKEDIPGLTIKYGRPGDDSFKAHNSVLQTINYPVGFQILDFPFDIEDSDPGNNYNNATFRYIPPVDGAYVFTTNMGCNVINQDVIGANGYIYLTMHSYDTIAQVVDSKTMVFRTEFLLPAQQSNFKIAVTLPIIAGVGGGYINFNIAVQTIPVNTLFDFNFSVNSSWSCINAAGQQNYFVKGNSQTMKAVEYDLQYPVSYPDFKVVLADMTGKAEITYDNPNDNISAWLKRIAWNVKTNMADIQLIGSAT